MGVPNVVLALALFLIYVMHADPWQHLGFDYRAYYRSSTFHHPRADAALLQLHKELEEAAHVTGATTARTLPPYCTSDFTGGGESAGYGLFPLPCEILPLRFF